MKKKDFLNELKIVFEVSHLNTSDNLEKLGYDSLKILELLALKETKFKKIDIKPNDFSKCKKIHDLEKIFKIKD